MVTLPLRALANASGPDLRALWNRVILAYAAAMRADRPEIAPIPDDFGQIFEDDVNGW